MTYSFSAQNVTGVTITTKFTDTISGPPVSFNQTWNDVNKISVTWNGPPDYRKPPRMSINISCDCRVYNNFANKKVNYSGFYNTTVLYDLPRI